MNRNTLRYVQLSQERHTIQGANVPGTAVQLQWSGAEVHRSLISIFSLEIAETLLIFYNILQNLREF